MSSGKSIQLEMYLALERLNKQSEGQLQTILANNPGLDVSECPLCGERGYQHLPVCYLATPDQIAEKVKAGRKPKIHSEQQREILRIAVERGRSLTELCALFKMGRNTMCTTLRKNDLWERYQALKKEKRKQ